MSSAEVIVENRSGVDLDLPRAGEMARAVLGRLGLQRGELGLTFVDPDEMAALNREHMGKDGATDVLSFPLDTAGDEEEDIPLLLGDVVICPREALARGDGDDVGAAVCLMVIHGVIHIGGFDHERDQGEMRALETELAGELCDG